MAISVGMIIPFYGIGTDLPPHFEPCDGRRFSVGQYPLLYNLLIRSANNDLLKLNPLLPYHPSTNTLPAGVIRLPDFRAEFLRGIYGSGDPLGDPPKPLRDEANRSRGLGAFQDDSIRRHHHNIPLWVKVWSGGPQDSNWHSSVGGGGSDFNVNNPLTDATLPVGNDHLALEETRPQNVAVNFIICAESDPGLVADSLLVLPADPRGPIPEVDIETALNKVPQLRVAPQP